MTIERPMFPPRAGVTEQAWHKRHAITLAGQLPDNTEDCLIILRLITQIVTDFLMQSDEAQKPSPVVAFVRPGDAS
jgi:hypothetical protein